MDMTALVKELSFQISWISPRIDYRLAQLQFGNISAYVNMKCFIRSFSYSHSDKASKLHVCVDLARDHKHAETNALSVTEHT